MHRHSQNTSNESEPKRVITGVLQDVRLCVIPKNLEASQMFTDVDRIRRQIEKLYGKPKFVPPPRK